MLFFKNLRDFYYRNKIPSRPFDRQVADKIRRDVYFSVWTGVASLGKKMSASQNAHSIFFLRVKRLKRSCDKFHMWKFAVKYEFFFSRILHVNLCQYQIFGISTHLYTLIIFMVALFVCTIFTIYSLKCPCDEILMIYFFSNN